MIRTTNDGYSECVGDVADRISDGRRGAAGKKQSDRLRASLGDDKGARITRGAKGAAVDEDLVHICDCELFSLAAAPLILYADVGTHGADGGAGEAGGAAAFGNSHSHNRCSFCARRYPHLQDV